MKSITLCCLALPLVIGGSQCTPRPTAALKRTERMSAKELVQTSSIIIVGTVAKIEPIEGEVHIPNSKTRARLKKVTITREITIKGQADQPELVYYRYDCTNGCAQLDYLSWLPEGSRRIFFLSEVDGMLRARVDVRASDFPVLSGLQPPPPANANELQAVARVLLRPGSQMEPAAFADNLFNARAISQELVGRAETLELMVPLLSHSSKIVEIQACLILAEAMYDYNGCLHSLVNDTNISEDQHRRVAKRIEGLDENQKQLRTAFMKDPMPWIRASSSSEQPNDIIDLLRVLAGHPDQLVSRRSCEILKESFPSVKDPACAIP